MIGILVSLALASAFYLSPYPLQLVLQMPLFNLLLIPVGVVTLFITALVHVLFLYPLQRMEKLSSRIMDLYCKNSKQRLVALGMLLYSLITLVMAGVGLSEDAAAFRIAVAIWICLTGVYIDLLRTFFKSSLRFLNPMSLTSMFTAEAKKCVRRDHDLDLCQWIDALTELALHSLARAQVQLSANAIDQVAIIEQHFLNCLKSLGHTAVTSHEGRKEEVAEEINYVLFYMFQRLELINEKAVEYACESLTTRIATILGKMAIAGAKFDLSLTAFPLHFLGKCVQKAQEKGFVDTPFQATCTLVEVAKTLATEVNITYMDIQTPFLSIIAQLEKIAKRTFKADKSMGLMILRQPFLAIQAMLKTEKFAAHQDTPVIMRDLDRVLSEFDALEMVMKSIPSIPPELKQE